MSKHAAAFQRLLAALAAIALGVLAAGAPGLLSASASAQTAPPAGTKPADAKGGGWVEKDPLEIRQEEDLRFGALVVMGRAAVTVPPTGLDVEYDGAVPLGDRPTAAAFLIRGKANRTVEVQLPSDGSVSMGPGAGVEDFKAEPEHRTGLEDLGGGRLRIRLNRSGENRLFVGGRMTLAGARSLGSLSAPFALHATYIPETLGNGAGK